MDLVWWSDRGITPPNVSSIAIPNRPILFLRSKVIVCSVCYWSRRCDCVIRMNEDNPDSQISEDHDDNSCMLLARLSISILLRRMKIYRPNCFDAFKKTHLDNSSNTTVPLTRLKNIITTALNSTFSTLYYIGDNFDSIDTDHHY